jgi:hypothetical protein
MAGSRARGLVTRAREHVQGGWFECRAWSVVTPLGPGDDQSLKND